VVACAGKTKSGLFWDRVLTLNSFWINYAVDRTISSETQTQWIVPLGLQLLPGTLLFCGMMFMCPESPRWLARKDRWEDAQKILVDIRKLGADHEYIHAELADIRQQVEQRSTMRMGKMDMFKKLFAHGTRNRIAIGLLLMACQNLTGVNIISESTAACLSLRQC